MLVCVSCDCVLIGCAGELATRGATTIMTTIIITITTATTATTTFMLLTPILLPN